jgi:hypothetical protein
MLHFINTGINDTAYCTDELVKNDSLYSLKKVPTLDGLNIGGDSQLKFA